MLNLYIFSCVVFLFSVYLTYLILPSSQLQEIIQSFHRDYHELDWQTFVFAKLSYVALATSGKDGQALSNLSDEKARIQKLRSITAIVLNLVNKFIYLVQPDIQKISFVEELVTARALASRLETEVKTETIALRIYNPNKSRSDKRKVLVWYHGGGWTTGSAEADHGIAQRWAYYTGYLVVSVDYRLAPEYTFPAAIDDSIVAFQWIKSNIGRYGGDENQIILAGESAGGNLAAAVASYEMNDIANQIIYGTSNSRMIEMQLAQLHNASNADDSASDVSSSPQKQRQLLNSYRGPCHRSFVTKSNSKIIQLQQQQSLDAMVSSRGAEQVHYVDDDCLAQHIEQRRVVRGLVNIYGVIDFTTLTYSDAKRYSHTNGLLTLGAIERARQRYLGLSGREASDVPQSRSQLTRYLQHLLDETNDGDGGFSSHYTADQLVWLYAPLHSPEKVIASFPPSLFVLAKHDVLTPENEAFITRLQAAAREVIVWRHPSVVHGFFQLHPLGHSTMKDMTQVLELL